jgi:glycosyltransferase involved in cell wall biosynthesis
MKILIVCGSITQAGTSRVISLLSQEWSKEHQVNFFVFKEISSAFKIDGNIVQSHILFHGCFWSKVVYLFWHLKKYHYDIIYGFSEDANLPLITAAKWAGVNYKVVLSVHILPERFSTKTRKKIIQYYPLAKKIIAVSQGVQDSLINIGLPKKLVSVVPNPIDYKSILSLANQDHLINLTDDTFLIVAMGRLHYHKGFDLLIASFAQIYHQLPNARLCIIGDGNELNNLIDLAQQLNVRHLITFTGGLTNPFSILAKAQVFVMSSRQESWGLVLVEAMALGVPVIAMDCPYGAREILNDGLYGKLVPCQDSDALTKGMLEILKNSHDLSAINAKAMLRAKQFDISLISNKWLTF